MSKAKGKDITKISDLIPDANNYNKGTEFGSGLIAKLSRKTASVVLCFWIKTVK